MNKRRRIMRTIGERPGSTSAKKYEAQYDTTTATYNTRTLWSDDISQLPKTTGTAGELDSRQRDIANLRGIKFCYEVRNDRSEPMYFNWAVISPKNSDVTSIPTADFFRDWTTARAIAFSNTLTGNDFHCRPINTDLYDVITHKRYVLAAANESATNASYTSNRSNYVNIMKYIKIGRQFRYDAGSSDAEGRRLFVVFWGDFWGRNSGSTGTSNIFMNRRAILYFREPK